VRKTDLSIQRRWLLEELSGDREFKGEGMTAGELAESNGVSKSTARNTLAALERQGLVYQSGVRRVPGQRGRPFVLWQITPNGCRALGHEPHEALVKARKREEEERIRKISETIAAASLPRFTDDDFGPPVKVVTRRVDGSGALVGEE
jgi:predicted ArsR family transcriptional regulator